MSFQKENKKDALKDYIEVNQRVIEFWQKYPNGRIQTEIVQLQNGVIIMKACGYRDIMDTIPFAVGHAYEKEDSTFINKTSYIENCETSAIGRMLGIGNFSAKKSIASKEEVANAIHQQEQQIDRTNDPSLKAKWTLLNGAVEGWEEFVQKVLKKGWTFAQIDEYMTTKIKERGDKTNE